jgi:hypothetical protein
MQSIKIIGALLLGLVPAATEGATFTVSSTAASGVGSLEAVIIAANATPGTDTIETASAGTGRVFAVHGSNATLRGLVLRNLASKVYGIRQSSSAGVLPVLRCFSGTDAPGSADLSQARAPGRCREFSANQTFQSGASP